MPRPGIQHLASAARRVFFQEPVCNERCLHLLLMNAIRKNPCDGLSGPVCAVIWSKYSLASVE